jgi:hypothetical protein
MTGPLARRSAARVQRTTVVLILRREWGLAKAWEDQKSVSLFLFVWLVEEKLSDLVHIHLRWLVAKIINWSPI